MLERRKLKRRHLIYYLRVFNRLNDALVGHLVDITTEGVMLISEEPIEIDKDFTFRMALPTGMWGKDDIEFDAQSVWCKRDINPLFFVTGFKLSNIPAELVAIIESLIENFGFRD
jgi:hypothetical protein